MNASTHAADHSKDHEATPASVDLRNRAIAELRGALSALPPGCSSRELAVPIASFAHAARHSQISPELFLVALKDAIVSIPQFDERRERRAELMEGSVTLAIKEYYANRLTSG